MKVNLLVWVNKENVGEQIREVKVDAAGMQVIMHLPKTGIIIGTADESALETIKATEGVDYALTEEQFKCFLEELPAPVP